MRSWFARRQLHREIWCLQKVPEIRSFFVDPDLMKKARLFTVSEGGAGGEVSVVVGGGGGEQDNRYLTLPGKQFSTTQPPLQHQQSRQVCRLHCKADEAYLNIRQQIHTLSAATWRAQFLPILYIVSVFKFSNPLWLGINRHLTARTPTVLPYMYLYKIGTVSWD